MRRLSRIELAYILSPLVPSVIFAIALHLSDMRLLWLTLLFSIPFSYVPALVFGIPYISFLKRKNRLNVINLLLSGAFAGGLVFYLFGITISEMLDSPRSMLPTVRELLSGAALGFLVALSFGVIAGIPFYQVSKNTKGNENN